MSPIAQLRLFTIIFEKIYDVMEARIPEEKNGLGRMITNYCQALTDCFGERWKSRQAKIFTDRAPEPAEPPTPPPPDVPKDYAPAPPVPLAEPSVEQRPAPSPEEQEAILDIIHDLFLFNLQGVPSHEVSEKIDWVEERLPDGFSSALAFLCPDSVSARLGKKLGERESTIQ